MCKNFFIGLSVSWMLLSLIVTDEAKAQSNFNAGYIVSLEHDTLYGMIDNRGAVKNAKQVLFTSSTGEKREYKPQELLGYTVSEKVYRTNIIRQERVIGEAELNSYFMLLLEEGKIDFFYLRDAEQADRYFIVKENGELEELTNAASIRLVQGQSKIVYDRKYIVTLRLALSDCQELPAHRIDVKFKERAIHELIREYNNCFREPTDVVYEVRDNKVRLRKEFYIGYASSTVVAEGLVFFHPTGRIESPLAAVAISATAPNISSSLSMRLAVEYLRKGAEGVGSTDFEFHYLNVKLFPSYNYPKGKIRPVVSGGFVYGRRMNNRELLIDTGSSQSRKYDAPNNEYGYGAEVGADFYFSKTTNQSINFRLGYTAAIMDFNFSFHEYFNHSSFLKLGYAF